VVDDERKPVVHTKKGQHVTTRMPENEVATATLPTASDPLWFKDAIIYQTHVRAFCDSNGDGIGDFRGLTEKLDYIRDLGVTAIWLLPFYPSPLKDDGYDIAEYRTIHPRYGTLDDFRKFLHEAHRRDLRVITELVINHTSDQHEWFRKSRQDKPGGPWRNFYVWEDTPQRFSEARIIFQDFETSNWEWDPHAGAYYWHRFYKHQPDLNFDNPEVRDAVREVLDFWLEMGVDGFRLDAVPYLFERDGTTCENLPETHAYLKDLRTHIDARYSDRMLLAEANQWPEDAAAYFGEGDECHMNFHFPLMPRLFMALQREDRFPIVDILQQTPEICENCQWGLFLRNHDELTLEMVTDEERDYMYRTYATDPQSRINLGIRRRLMPLLGNSRRKIELMNGLLFSLPGTPIVYYGDEIGMGDNIYLGDRDSVRTPMQWSPDRNAGFSRANPQQLVLPPIVDPEYHYTAVNVEAQENNPHSLLWWMRRVMALRNRHAVFGRGTLEFLLPENGKVLAFIRQYANETVLVVANLSRIAQYVELNLSNYAGTTPIEMFGRMRFPQVGELPYLLTLGPHSFYWFELKSPAAPPSPVSASSLPVFRVSERWEEVFDGRSRSKVESALLDFFPRQEWFDERDDVLQSIAIRDVASVPGQDGSLEFLLVLANADYANRDTQTYLLPLKAVPGDQARDIYQYHPESALLRVLSEGQPERLVYAAGHENEFHMLCVRAIRDELRWQSGKGEVVASRTAVFDEILPRGDELPRPGILEAERSQESVNLADRFHDRIFRRIDSRMSPELEMGRVLSETSPRPPVPRLAGCVEYTHGDTEPLTLAVLHEYVPNEGTARQLALEECRQFIELAVAHSPQAGPSLTVRQRSPLAAALETPAPVASELIGPFLQSVELMGLRTAELHVALAAAHDDPAFSPETLTTFSQRGLVQSMRSSALRAFDALRRRQTGFSEPLRQQAANVLERQEQVLGCYESLRRESLHVTRIRCHGNYGLNQLLHTGRDFFVTGFRGDVDRPVSERRIKQSPLFDLAAMLRSLFTVSRAVALTDVTGLSGRPEGIEHLSRFAEFWFAETAASFLKGYTLEPGIGSLIDASNPGQQLLLEAYLLDRFVQSLRAGPASDSPELRIALDGLLYVVRMRQTSR
jgi:maltose alpha-D-glucosyltransferase/alpha-amylase